MFLSCVKTKDVLFLKSVICSVMHYYRRGNGLSLEKQCGVWEERMCHHDTRVSILDSPLACLANYFNFLGPQLFICKACIIIESTSQCNMNNLLYIKQREQWLACRKHYVHACQNHSVRGQNCTQGSVAGFENHVNNKAWMALVTAIALNGFGGLRKQVKISWAWLVCLSYVLVYIVCILFGVNGMGPRFAFFIPVWFLNFRIPQLFYSVPPTSSWSWQRQFKKESWITTIATDQ